MRVWRIYNHQAPYARSRDFDPLSGAGGLIAPGRWSVRGHPVLYAASSPSLAVLETLVHVPAELFGERTLLELELPESLERVSEQAFIQLLRNALAEDPEAATRAFGSGWLTQGRSLALEVPSLVMPIERNYLVNPQHELMRLVAITRRELVTLDPRLTRLRLTGSS